MEIRSLAAVAVVVVCLTGCGAPTPAPQPSEALASSPPVVLEVPQPRLPLTCGQALPDVSRAALFGEPLALVYGPEASLRGVRDVQNLQAGFLNCEWGEPSGASLRFTATPDGVDLYETWVEYVVPSPYFEIDAHGDRSVTYCGYGSCFFYLLIGDHAIEGVANRPELMDDAVLRPLFTPLVQTLADRIEAALPEARDPWTPPRPAPAWGPCPQAPAMAAIASAIGRPEAVPVGLEHALDLASQRVGSEACNLGATSYEDVFMGVHFVPSGAWSMPAFIAQPEVVGYEAEYEVVEIDGRGQALVASGSYGYSYALFAADGGLVSLWWVGVMTSSELATHVAVVGAALEGD